MTPDDIRAAIAAQAVIDWVRGAHATSRWTTSVCTGALILGAAGILSGLEATTHWAASRFLPLFGARYSAQRVVKQGKVITAAGVSAGIDMALSFAADLAGQESAEAIQLVIEYDPQPPFDAGAPHKAQEAVAKQAKRMLTGR